MRLAAEVKAGTVCPKGTAELKVGTENMHRSLRYKVVQFRRGNCTNCSTPRGDSPFLRLCETCGEDKKKKRRKKLGSKPWKAGNPGRPPAKKPVSN